MANALANSWRLQEAERFMTAATRAFEVSDYETAVSRAYYAAFHAFVAILESRIGVRRERWSHNFRPYFDRFPDLEELRRPVADLYAARTAADYEVGVFSTEAVTTLLSAASMVLLRARQEG